MLIDQLAAVIKLELSGPRIIIALVGLDDEEALATDGDVERISGFFQRPLSDVAHGRYIADKGQVGAAQSSVVPTFD